MECNSVFKQASHQLLLPLRIAVKNLMFSTNCLVLASEVFFAAFDLYRGESVTLKDTQH